MPSIEFSKLWEDDDKMLQILLCATGDEMKSTQDFYIYPETLKKFANDLAEYFPKLGEGVVLLEYGSEDASHRSYSYVKIEVSYRSIHSATIEIKTNNNSEGKELSKANYFLNTDIPNINNMGKRLSSWLETEEKYFEYSWNMA